MFTDGPQRIVLLLILALSAGSLLLTACGDTSGSSSNLSFEEVSVENPLPPCPDSLLCLQESMLVREAPPEQVFETIVGDQGVLDHMGAVSISANERTLRIEAVFEAFLFEDEFDVKVAPYPEGEGSLVHVRSSAIIGSGVFDVNRQRIDRFYDDLAMHLEQQV